MGVTGQARGAYAPPRQTKQAPWALYGSSHRLPAPKGWQRLPGQAGPSAQRQGGRQDGMPQFWGTVAPTSRRRYPGEPMPIHLASQGRMATPPMPSPIAPGQPGVPGAYPGAPAPFLPPAMIAELPKRQAGPANAANQPIADEQLVESTDSQETPVDIATSDDQEIIILPMDSDCETAGGAKRLASKIANAINGGCVPARYRTAPNMIGDTFQPIRQVSLPGATNGDPATLTTSQMFNSSINPPPVLAEDAVLGQTYTISVPGVGQVQGQWTQPIVQSGPPGSTDFDPAFVVTANATTLAELNARLAANNEAINGLLITAERAVAPNAQAVESTLTPTGTGLAVQEDPFGPPFFLYRTSYGLVLTSRVLINLPGAAASAMKVSENNSPVPQNRVYFSYNNIDNMRYTLDGTSVQQFTPGFEKTFFEGLTSLEMRFPISSTLSRDMILDGITNDGEGAFGNIGVILKALIYETPTLAFTGGLGIGNPTADGVRLNMADGTNLVRVDNNAFHLQPFLAMLESTEDGFFFQAFAGFDFNANSNTVYANTNGTGLTNIGELYDQNLLFLDAQMGMWLCRSRTGWIRGIAPLFEMHYTATMGDADRISNGPFVVNSSPGRFDILTLTAGMSAELPVNSNLSFGFTFPVKSDSLADREFDYEFGLRLNKYFGQMSQPNPLTNNIY
ncbi:hypothetical protein [Planctomycetes bacterium Pan216]